MKSVLISIKPEWCDLIARGDKTLEVRKTRPKLDAPFKCYIYRTKGKVKHILNGKWFNMYVGGSVIGEFICDKVFDIGIEISEPNNLHGYPFPCTGMTDIQILEYLGNGNMGYCWHISDLKIYDVPKELKEFHAWKKCKSCRKSGYESTACAYDENCMVPAAITKAPQSWCYVEEV